MTPRSFHRRLVRALAAGVVVLAAMPAAATAAPLEPATAGERVTVVVTLRGEPALAASGASERTDARQLRAQHADTLAAARARGIALTTRARYDSVLNGLAVTVPAAQIHALRELPGVTGVHPNTEYHATLADAVPHIRAPELWDRVDGDGAPVKGTGRTVAVLDTGIDYRHSDLGGCLGAGCRVVGGHDFVNGDDDPLDDNFHGTHVAGIIGASGAVTGVAPDVRLLAYKVLDQFGDGTLADILAGLDAATDPFNPHSPTVVNMSLGNDSGDGTDLLSQAVQTATEAGFVVVVAAGNTGPGVESMGAPAAAPGALTVGASTTGVFTPRARIVAPRPYDPKASRLEFSANPRAGTTRLDLVDVGRGTAEDYERVDVRGKVVLVDSGDSPYSWFQSGLAAEQHGAAAALIAEADPEEPVRAADDWPTGSLASGDDGRLDSLVALKVAAATAADLRGMLATERTTLAIDAVDATDAFPAFSSRGPSGLLGTKPDLVAPGVEIRSTVPEELFGARYGRGSGTSMAAPMVSGAAALLSQLHPRWSSDRIAAAVTATARQLGGAGPLTQGAGLLDVAAAADAAVTASPRVASLGLADMAGDRVRESTTITLTNHSTSARTLRLDVREATGTAAGVSVSPRTVRLVGGERADVEVTVSVDADEDLDVSGWIRADDLSVPYSLSVRPLDTFATPDPAIDGSEIFVRAPAALAGAPRVTVTGPRGFRRTVSGRLDHGYWWRARVPTGPAGVYSARAAATVTAPYGGAQVTGTTTFEVLDRRPGTPKWRAVGPYGSGGELASSPTGSGRILVASDRTASLFGSADGGRTWWQRSNLPMAGGSGFGAQPVLEEDPTRTGGYYLGIDAGFADPTYRGALLVTDDSGAGWERLPFPDARVFDLAVSADGRSLAVVSDDAFYISADRGRTWRTLWGDWSFATDAAIDGDRAYLATSDGIWAYDDIDGELAGPVRVLTRDYMVAVAAQDGNVFAWSGWSGEPIVASADAGRTWRDAFLPTRDFQIGHALNIEDGDVWATSDGGVWIGEDLGASWSAAAMPQQDLVVGDVEPVDDRLVLSSEGGLFASHDGAATYRRIGIQGVDVSGLALTRGSDGRSRLVAGTTWDTYSTLLGRDGAPASPDWGASPKEGQFGAETYFVGASPDDPRLLYKVSNEGFGVFGVYRSEDGGETWELRKKLAQRPTSFLVHPADPDSLYIGFQYWDRGQGLFISHDAGATWRREPMDRPPLALAGDPRDPSRVYAGDEQGLYLSDDAGRTFVRRHEVATTAIEVDPTDRRHLILGGSRLYESRDRGATLRAARYLPLAVRVSDVAFGPRDRVYAATSSHYDEGLLEGGRGVLVSRNGGRRYEPVNAGLGTLDALSLAVGHGGRVYAGLRGGGVYVLDP